MKKKLRIVLLLVCAAVLLSGCKKQNTKETLPDEGTPGVEAQTPTQEENLNAEAVNEELQAAIDAVEEKVRRSLLSTGNTARLKAVMNRMQAGEEVTVAYIGGSITEGYLVNTKQNYPIKTTNWLRSYFNNENIKHVNAGLSGTSSTIGLLRLQDDVLSKNPDLVVVEFAVNDAQDSTSKMMYESLVKECLTWESAPAVILLFTVTETGYTCEEQMKKVGAAYELPMISVNAMLKTELESGALQWSDYSVDDVHPSNAGHTMISECLQYLFLQALAGKEEEEPDYASLKAYGAAYAGMTFYTKDNFIPEEYGGFAESASDITHFPNGWQWTKGETGSMKFTMNGRNLVLLYKEANSDKLGTAEVYIDGKLAAKVNGNAADGWNNPETALVLNDVTEGQHTVEIKMAEGFEDKLFHLLGIGTTGTLLTKEIVDESKLPYVERALINEGNTYRLYEVIKRAKAGEALTIGFIGGSITQGSGASKADNCYAKLVYDWWCKTFPEATFTFVNAGIGATTSQFACARVESDLLAYEPDFVVVEFSVNDESTSKYAETYESLLRLILTDASEPAVLVLNMVQYNNGVSAQATHNKVAERYELPIISMRESIYKEIVLGNLTAADVSADNLHPNDRGHAYAAEIVTHYLEQVVSGEIAADTSYTVPEQKGELPSMTYVRYDSRNSEPVLAGFEADTGKQNGVSDVFKNGYFAKEEGASITFTVSGTDISLQYRKTNRMNAPLAVAIVDGNEAAAVTLDGNYENGWGDWLYLQDIASGLLPGEHTVEIRLTTTGSKNDFYLVSVLTKTAAAEADQSVKGDTMRDITSKELVSELTIGWNLGNTLDATGGNGLSSESSWGNPVTTKEMIDVIREQGFNTVRIPTTWTNHFGPAPDYKIDEAWMERVQEVVDYAYGEGMYVILNFHHENWHFPSYDNAKQAETILTALWTQVANHFEGYNEHLIFEGLNEPRMTNTQYEWNGGNKEGQDVVNQLNAAFVKAVRATGGNNAIRSLMVPTYAATTNGSAVQNFVIPDDDRLIISIHAYTPYNFALNEAGTTTFDAAKKSDTQDITWLMETIKKNFLDKGYPVIIGEFGARNKDNLSDRVEWAQYYVKTAKSYGVPCVWWDNGAFTGSGECFGLLDRRSLNIMYPEIVEALMKGLE